MYQALAKILKIENNVIKTENKEPLAITAVWCNWGFRQTLKLVLCLEVGL